MLQQVIKQWFWDCYDHLGRLLVVNFLLFFLLLAVGVYTVPLSLLLTEGFPQGLRILLLALVFLVLAPIGLALWFAPLMHFGTLVSAEKDPALRVFLEGIRRQFFRLWRFFLICCMLLVILAINLWFYTTGGFLSGTMATVGYLLAGVCFWLGVLVVASMVAGIPILIRQQRTARAALKAGFLMMLKYPRFVFGAVLLIVSLWIIGAALKFAGILLFGFAGTAMFLNSVYDVLSITEDRQEKAATESGDNRPRTWKELRSLEKEEDAERMERARYERTLRDILKPWEG